MKRHTLFLLCLFALAPQNKASAEESLDLNEEFGLDESFEEPAPSVSQAPAEPDNIPLPEIEEETPVAAEADAVEEKATEKIVEQAAQEAEPDAVEGTGNEPVAEIPPEVPVQSEEIVESPSRQVASQPGAPNEALEKRLYEIYLRYQQKPIADSEWLSIVGSKANEEYAIQTGNTLWDISHTFFGDGAFWPKIWSMNGEITNPHLIVPGNKILFTPGDISQAPKLAVHSGVEGEPADVQADASEIEIPPPSKSYAPVLNDFPRSLPMRISDEKNEEYDAIGFDGKLKDPVAINQLTVINEQAVDTQPTALGQIVEIEGGNAQTASTYQYVFVQSDRNLQTGDRLTAFHMKPEGTPEVVQFEGDLVVTDHVHHGLYKALVTKAIDSVRVGSAVVEGRMDMADPSAQGPSGNVEATILGGLYDGGRKFAAVGDLVFLDKGSQHGLKSGELLSVIASPILRNPKTLAADLKQPVGLLKVVAVSGTVATALVVDVSGVIYTGDKTASASMYLNKEQPVQFKSRDAMDLGEISEGPSTSGGVVAAPEEDVFESDMVEAEAEKPVSEELSLDSEVGAPKEGDAVFEESAVDEDSSLDQELSSGEQEFKEDDSMSLDEE